MPSAVDDRYEQIVSQRRAVAAEEARVAAVARRKAEQDAALLRTTRSTVAGTIEHEIGLSSFSWAFQVRYCKECPCIAVWRRDHNKLAFRFPICVENNAGWTAVPGGPWHEVNSNANWLRSNTADLAAKSVADQELGLHPYIKYALVGLSLLAAAAVLPFIVVAIVEIVFRILISVLLFIGCILAFGMFLGILGGK